MTGTHMPHESTGCQHRRRGGALGNSHVGNRSISLVEQKHVRKLAEALCHCVSPASPEAQPRHLLMGTSSGPSGICGLPGIKAEMRGGVPISVLTLRMTGG